MGPESSQASDPGGGGGRFRPPVALEIHSSLLSGGFSRGSADVRKCKGGVRLLGRRMGLLSHSLEVEEMRLMFLATALALVAGPLAAQEGQSWVGIQGGYDLQDNSSTATPKTTPSWA